MTAAAGQRAVLLPLSPCQTIVGISGARGGPAVLAAAEQSTLVTPSRHGAAAAAAPDQGGEARLDLSEGSAVVMMLALRDSPWRQPRNPARHISPKALVLRAECLLERRFFDHHHPDMKKKPE